MEGEHRPNQETEQAKDVLVRAKRLSVVFSDKRILQQIADELLQDGSISGYTIEPVRSGYVYTGKKVKEAQWQLNTLTGENKDTVDSALMKLVQKHIGMKWDVPAIVADEVSVNPQLLTFINNARVEHDRFVKERRRGMAFLVSTLITVSATVGTLVDNYFDSRDHKIQTIAQKAEIDRLKVLHVILQRQIEVVDKKIIEGTLTTTPNDMTANDSFRETQEVLAEIRAVIDKLSVENK